MTFQAAALATFAAASSTALNGGSLDLLDVFHGALVGADFVVATGQQGCAPGVHAFANFVIFDAGFHVGGTLRLDKLALEGLNFFGIEELDPV